MHCHKVGISEKSLKILAFLFLFSGAVGKGIFENILVGESSLDSAKDMGYATAAIALQGLSCAAIPLFVFFLIRSAEKERKGIGAAIRIFLLALLCEIPYNLVLSGKLWDAESRNPVFALFLCLVVLMAWDKYGNGVTGITVRASTIIAALFWAAALSVEWGLCAVTLCTVMRAFWKSESLRLSFGSIALAVCSMFSPIYMIAPISLILLGFYKES